MQGTAMKDIGIPSLEALGPLDVIDYNYFVDACTGMGSAYLQAKIILVEGGRSLLCQTSA
eukprot:scaffold149335_cov18-Prasinocladus_malaysianus.AAC.1